MFTLWKQTTLFHSCVAFKNIQEHFNEMKNLLEIFFGSFVMSTANVIQKVISKIKKKKKINKKSC